MAKAIPTMIWVVIFALIYGGYPSPPAENALLDKTSLGLCGKPRHFLPSENPTEEKPAQNHSFSGLYAP